MLMPEDLKSRALMVYRAQGPPGQFSENSTNRSPQLDHIFQGLSWELGNRGGLLR